MTNYKETITNCLYTKAIKRKFEGSFEDAPPNKKQRTH